MNSRFGITGEVCVGVALVSSEFRQIAIKGRGQGSESLFRAAVSAFCSLTRPNRRDTIQLEDLTLAVYDGQTVEARRFAAAALSEAAPSLNRLIERLVEEPAEVCAPLLVRSDALPDALLVGLISRHGIRHARAIARRRELHPAIAGLIRALKILESYTQEQTVEEALPQHITPPIPAEDLPVFKAANADPKPERGAAAERMRERLRAFMLQPEEKPNNLQALPGRNKAIARLRMTALSGNKPFFHTALADALEIDFNVAASIADSAGYTLLIAAFKTLEMNEEQAFMITVAVFPTFFSHAESVRLFAERYQMLNLEAARDLVRGWKAESAARSFLRAQPVAADNSDKPLPVATVTRLRA